MINTTINQFLTKQLPNLKIAVVGDVMVDRYVFGDVSRISPEAPVPVNRVSKMKEVLGGAGNVASNLSNLDCKVYLGALAGNDDHGRLLQHLLDTDKIDTTGLITSDDRSTITKMRILGDRQQMMRLDFETITDLTYQEEQQLSSWLENLCKVGIDGIVVSDYGKGVCTPTLLKTIFSLAKEYGVQTIVDPKGADWSKYNGATCITPNVKELGECVGRKLENDDATIVEAAKSVLATVDLDYIVATRSAKGITVIAKDGRTWHNPATQQEVFDVSGAGDTVVSMMMTCLASGLSMRLALHIANGAAGIVVSKVGTYPIHRSELLDLWHSYKHSIQSKPLYTKEEMKMVNETRKILHNDAMRVTATTVRVPVFDSHSESINVEFEKPFDLDELIEVLKNAPGVVVQNDSAHNEYPMAVTAAGKDEVFIGRIRRDESVENGVNLWVVADNIRKGAATNAVQIAEEIIKAMNE